MEGKHKKKKMCKIRLREHWNIRIKHEGNNNEWKVETDTKKVQRERVRDNARI